MYTETKLRGIYLPLFTEPEGDSCFSIYQIRWIKKRFFNFFFGNFRETTHHFTLCSQNRVYPRIFRVTGANQNAQKLLSTDLVNTKYIYYIYIYCSSFQPTGERGSQYYQERRRYVPCRQRFLNEGPSPRGWPRE